MTDQLGCSVAGTFSCVRPSPIRRRRKDPHRRAVEEAAAGVVAEAGRQVRSSFMLAFATQAAPYGSILG